MPIKNLIITGANTAREINPEGSYVKEQLPGHSDSCNCNSCDKIFNDWSKAEQSLKEYRITHSRNFNNEVEPWDWAHLAPQWQKYFDIGTKHHCEVNEETLEAIIL